MRGMVHELLREIVQDRSQCQPFHNDREQRHSECSQAISWSSIGIQYPRDCRSRLRLFRNDGEKSGFGFAIPSFNSKQRTSI